MSSKHDAAMGAQATLVPLHGGLERKARVLDKEAILIGRAHGCDIRLESAEISSVHCLVTRGSDGWRLRDCNSRAGTRLNGDQVKVSRLHDGDLVQLGPFCFQVQLPELAKAGPAGGHEVQRLQKSRRRLVKLALTMRRRLQELAGPLGMLFPEDLNRKASGLRQRIRSYNQRLTQLEEAERDLCQDRDILEREREAHRSHVDKVERELVARLKEADAEIRRRWQDFQKRCDLARRSLAYENEDPELSDSGLLPQI